MTEEAPKGKYRELMKSCPILYRQRKLPMNESCMCFGMECGEGWYEPLRKLSNALETINLTLGKEWRFAIEAAQVKEKFGTLRFYYDIRTHRKYSLGYFLAAPFDFIFSLLRDRRRHVWHQPKKTLRYHTCYTFGLIGSWLYDTFTSSSWIRKQELVISTVDDFVNDLIRRAEDECFNLCEDCGKQINQPWSPRCETTGWITYVCEDCAKKTGGTYVIHLTKEEISKYEDMESTEVKATIARNGKHYRNGVEET